MNIRESVNWYHANHGQVGIRAKRDFAGCPKRRGGAVTRALHRKQLECRRLQLLLLQLADTWILKEPSELLEDRLYSHDQFGSNKNAAPNRLCR
jgi:hypothetical protein